MQLIEVKRNRKLISVFAYVSTVPATVWR